MNAMFSILVDSAAKGLILLALAWLVAAAMRRSSASARHMAWALALCGLLLIPILSAALPKWQLPILPNHAIVAPIPQPATAQAPSRPAPIDAPAIMTSSPMPPVAAQEPPAPMPQPRTTMALPPLPPGAWLTAIWLGVGAAALVPLCAGMVCVGRLIRRSKRLDDAPWPELVRSLSAQLSLRRPVRLFKTDAPTMPMAVGVVRPAIILPAESDTWPDEKRRAVLLHELAHIRRWDCLTHILTRLACVVHWFNPLAWMALHRLQNERERACDDLAIEAGARPVNYAHQLLEIARTMQAGAATATAAIPMARKTQLEGRLLAILDATRNRRGLTRFATVLSIALAAGILLPLSCARLTKAGTNKYLRPPITLSAHKYYVTGGAITVNISIGNWDYESSGPMRKFLRFEGRDYPIGYASVISGNAGEGFGLQNPVPNGMRPDEMPWLKPGKHKISIVVRDVKIRAKSNTQEKQPVLASFDEVVTNEVEYEVVDRFPDGYFELIRDKKLVDAVRQKFAGIRYWPGNSYPSFRLHWKAGLPVNLAYDIAIQAENETTTRTVATIALEAGGDEHSYCLSMTENSEFPKELEGKRIRLIMTPSFKAAMSEPSIRKFYGETVVTDWMRLKLDIDSAAINLQDIGITRRTHTDVKQNEGVSEQKALGVVLRPGKDGGGIEVMSGRNSRIMQLSGIREPKDALNMAQASLEQLAASETKRIPAQPDDFTWIAIQTDFDENLVMLIDASVDLDQQFSWWNLDQKTTSLVVVTGEPNDKQRYEMGLGHGSMTQFYMKAKKHLGQLEWKYLGDGPTGKKYHLEFSEQAGMPFKQVMAKDIEYKSGNLTIFDNGETWIGIEVKSWGTTGTGKEIRETRPAINQTSGSLTIHIVDPAGGAIASAEALVQKLPLYDCIGWRRAQDGIVVFERSDLADFYGQPVKECIVSVRAKGYAPQVVRVIPGQNQAKTIALNQGKAIEMTLQDEAGRPIPDTLEPSVVTKDGSYGFNIKTQSSDTFGSHKLNLCPMEKRGGGKFLFHWNESIPEFNVVVSEPGFIRPFQAQFKSDQWAGGRIVVKLSTPGSTQAARGSIPGIMTGAFRNFDVSIRNVNVLREYQGWKRPALEIFAQAANRGETRLFMDRNGHNWQIEVDGKWYEWVDPRVYTGASFNGIPMIIEPHFGQAITEFLPGALFDDLHCVIDRNWREIPAGHEEQYAMRGYGDSFIVAKPSEYGEPLNLEAGKHRVRLAIVCTAMPYEPYRSVSAPVSVEVLGQSGPLSAAEARLAAAEKALETAQGQYNAGVALRVDVRKAEYELARAKADAGGDRKAALEAKLKWAEEELSTAKGQYDAGVAPRENVRKAEIQLKEAEAELARFKARK
ncbi:MAG: M56 family metallopeptidase [Candidatus Sumerlaeia bacterium]